MMSGTVDVSELASPRGNNPDSFEVERDMTNLGGGGFACSFIGIFLFGRGRSLAGAAVFGRVVASSIFYVYAMRLSAAAFILSCCLLSVPPRRFLLLSLAAIGWLEGKRRRTTIGCRGSCRTTRMRMDLVTVRTAAVHAPHQPATRLLLLLPLPRRWEEVTDFCQHRCRRHHFRLVITTNQQHCYYCDQSCIL